MTTDSSKLEINTKDIQDYFNGESVVFADIENYVSGQIKTRQGNRKTPMSNVSSSPKSLDSGFYVSQLDYIDYQIAKRERRKKQLRRKKTKDSLGKFILWTLQLVFGLVIGLSIFWGFYMLCWYLQQTHTNF